MDCPLPLAVADDEERSRLRFLAAVAWLQLLGAVHTAWELQRLLDNAIKFSKKGGGRVSLRARADDEWVVIEVED